MTATHSEEQQCGRTSRYCVKYAISGVGLYHYASFGGYTLLPAKVADYIAIRLPPRGSKDWRNRVAKAVGRSDAPLLVAMVNPPSEKMMSWFWARLHECSILKSDVRIVYLIDDAPANSGNRPSVAQLNSASERFQTEVAESTPKVVVPLGGDALFRLTGIKQNIFDARGYLITNKYFHPVPCKIYQQVGEYKTTKKDHYKKGDPRFRWVNTSGDALLGSQFTGYVIPAFGLDHVRTEEFAVSTAFKADFLRASRALKGTLDIIEKDFRYVTEISAFHENSRIGRLVAVDIETHGMDNEVIDLVSFSDGISTASVPWNEQARQFMCQLFADTDRIFAIHNSAFDIPRLIANGVVISQYCLDHQIYDTLWGGLVLQPDLHKSLCRMATVYLDLEPWKGQRGSVWHELGLADPIYYSAKDSYVTVRLAEKLIPITKSIGMWNLVMGEGGHPGPGVMATIPILTDMSKQGIAISREVAKEWGLRLERKLARYLTIWSKQFGTLNPFSNNEMAKLFYGEWQLPIQKNKEEGITTDELACIRLQAYIESEYASQQDKDGLWQKDKRCTPRFFELVLRLRDCAKTLSTYVLPASMNESGRVHPQYMPVSKDSEHDKTKRKSQSKGNTSTGRLAAYDPNMQNQPHKIRRMYIPDTPDMTFVDCDYTRAELYAMAYSARDKTMIADLEGDPYQVIADQVGISRKLAKAVVLAGQYLAGPKKVSEMILKDSHMFISPATCKLVLDGIAQRWSAVAAYKRILADRCVTQRYVINPFGRIRFFYSGRAPAAVDFIPQSIVADVLWCVLGPVAALARELGGRLTTTVHDNILIQVPSQRVPEAAMYMKEIMEQKFHCVYPGFFIPVEVKVAPPGAAWSEVRLYEIK